MNDQLVVTPGDILVQPGADGTWRTVRILAVDEVPDGASTAHCLTYEPSPGKPTMASIAELGVHIWHAPVLASSFGSGWEHLGSQVVSKEELTGFNAYLKLTDFPRWLEITGQDAGELVGQANEHYQLANTLSQQGRRAEAIEEYTAAVELFPLFYEALDNRAFTCMDLGRYEDALGDFELSLRVNPEGVAAFFSKAECLMKLGELSQAEVIFSQGMTRFPEQRDLFAKFLKQVRAMQ